MAGPIERGRITPFEGGLLVLAAVFWAVLFIPVLAVEVAGHDGWLSAIPATLFGLAVLVPVIALERRFPGHTLVGIARQVLGPPLGAVTGALYAWWFVSVGALSLRGFAELIHTVVLPRTPIAVVLASLLAVTAINVRSGLEVMARVNQLLTVFVVAFVAALIVLSVRDLQPDNWKPVLENGAKPLLKGAYIAAGFFGEGVIGLMMVTPFLNRRSRAGLALGLAIVAAGLLMMSSTFWYVGVMGADLAGRLRFLPVEIARFVSIAEFLERVEALTVSFWVLANFAKLSIWYYAAATSCAEVMGLGDYRPLTWPMGLLIGELSLHFFRSQTEFYDFIRYSATPYMTLFEVAIPVLLWAVAAVRRRRAGPAPTPRQALSPGPGSSPPAA